MDIYIRVVDEHARLHVAFCIDVQISPASRDTSAYILSIVLEVHAEDRLCLTELTDAVIHLFPLFRSREQLCHCAVSYRHIVETPHEQGAALDHHIIELFAAHVLEVLTGVAYGNTKRQLMLFHQLHCMAHFVVYAVTAPPVISLLESLQADRRDEVLHPEHFLTELFIDHRSIRKCKKLAVRVHLANLKDIFLADCRLAACIDIHICSNLFALTHDRINILKA